MNLRFKFLKPEYFYRKYTKKYNNKFIFFEKRVISVITSK